MSKAWWTAWFLLLIAVSYSPLLAPYEKVWPMIAYMPFTLFWWLLMTLILLASVIVFAIRMEAEFR